MWELLAIQTDHQSQSGPIYTDDSISSRFDIWYPLSLQSVAATSMVVHDERAWRTRNAPMPEELIWENLGMVSKRVAGAGRPDEKST
jgi:hypothetical protein